MYTPDELRAIAVRVHHAEAEAALEWASGEIERMQAVVEAARDAYDVVEWPADERSEIVRALKAYDEARRA